MSTRAERRERKTADDKMSRLRRGECMNCGHAGPSPSVRFGVRTAST